MNEDNHDTTSTDDPGEAIGAIHDHLEATAELPVDPTASTYLGEAAAVAADAQAAIRDGQHEAAVTRIQQVRELLTHVDDTGNEDANEHVTEAARSTDEFLAAENNDN